MRGTRRLSAPRNPWSLPYHVAVSIQASIQSARVVTLGSSAAAQHKVQRHRSHRHQDNQEIGQSRPTDHTLEGSVATAVAKHQSQRSSQTKKQGFAQA